MLSWIKTASIAGAAAIVLAAATVTTSAPANAQRFGGGFHGGGFHGGGFHGGFRGGGFHGGWRGGGWRGFGPGFAGGLALGAIATAPYWGYDNGCGPVERVVGYDAWGQPLVQVVDSCW
jgi:hypothetical protein